jgi:hypothetical protein
MGMSEEATWSLKAYAPDVALQAKPLHTHYRLPLFLNKLMEEHHDWPIDYM